MTTQGMGAMLPVPAHYVFEYLTDPGHGRLKVPLALVRQFRVMPSRYSYRDRDHAYLEEDCDMGAFLDILTAHGCMFRLVERHTDEDAECRDFERF